MNLFKRLHTRVSSLMARVFAIMAVGLAPSASQTAKYSFLGKVSSVFCGRAAFKASQKFLAATIICTIFAFGMVVTPAEASTTYIRKEAHSPEAQKDIESLKIALAEMRKRGCDDPLSWYYQGAIHWVPTGDDQMQDLESDPLCPSYTKNNHELKPAWDNCTHTDAPTSDPNFLVWHRFYLYHFENIVRSLSGNENFAMPYWRYVNLDSNTKNPGDIILTMPEAFRTPTENNSLYEDERFTKLLKGEKIEQEFAEKFLYNGVEDINKDIFFKDFSSKIETAPHNKMHNYLGTGLSGPDPDPQTKFNKIFNGVFNGDRKANPEQGDGLMTNVESAGFDPIFWMHHGNIDRLWDQWTNSQNGKYVTLSDLHIDGQDDWNYTFFDPIVEPDSTIGSKKVNYTLQDVIDNVYNLGYKYDDTPMVQPPSKRLLAEVSQPSTPPTRLALQEVGQVVSSDRPIDLQIPVQPQVATELRRLRDGNLTRTATKGFTLEIDVTYTGRHYGSYDVYLNLPDEESKRDIDTYFAGSISFFVIPSAKPVTKTFRFDITDELLLQLEKLGERMNNEKLSVSIRKANGSENESVKIERVSLYPY